MLDCIQTFLHDDTMILFQDIVSLKIYFTRMSECGCGWQSWSRLQGKRRKDNFWKGLPEVVGTEASQAPVQRSRQAQLL